MTSETRFVRRLQMGLGALVVLSLLVLAGVLTAEQHARSAVAGSQTALSLLHDFQQVQIQFASTRAAEREFLLEDLRAPGFFQTGSSAGLERQAEALASLEELLDRLERDPAATDHGVVELHAEVATYRESFDELVQRYEERGWLYSGVLGEMRQATFEMRDLLEPLDANYAVVLRSELLELIRDQGDYLRDLDNRPRFLVGERIQILREEAAPAPARTEAAVAVQIAAYEAAWKRLLEIDDEIGRSSGSGLRGRLRSAEEAVALAVAESVTLARARFDAATSDVARTAALARWTSAGGAALTVAIALLVAISLGRHLRSSLAALLGAVVDYAGGNRAARVGELPHRDEFAVVAEAFDRMAETLGETTEELEEINASLELAVKGDTDGLVKQIKQLVAERKQA